MLSKKTQYAFKALTFIAERKKEGPVLIAEIAKKKRYRLNS
jgi:DNA-binding IscR family transcriptional regulator